MATEEIYYKPLRTHILARESAVTLVASDLLDYGLHDRMWSVSRPERLAEIAEAFEPVEDEPGTLLFEDVTATCGTDCDDTWPERGAQRMLEHALPGSYFEVASTGRLTAHRFEQGKKRVSRQIPNPFDEAEVRRCTEAASTVPRTADVRAREGRVAVPVLFIPEFWYLNDCTMDAAGIDLGWGTISNTEFDASPVLDTFGDEDLDVLTNGNAYWDDIVYTAQQMQLLPQWSGPFRIEFPDLDAYAHYVSERRGA